MTSGCSGGFSPPPPIPSRAPPTIPPRTYHKPPVVPSRHLSPSSLAPRIKRHRSRHSVAPPITLPATPSLPILVSAEVHPLNDDFHSQVSSYSSPDMHVLTFPYKSSAPSRSKQSNDTTLIRPAPSWESQSSRAVPNIYVATEPKLSMPLSPKKLEEIQESASYPPPPSFVTLPPMKVSPSTIYSRGRRKKMRDHWWWTLAWVLIVILFCVGVIVVIVPVTVIITKHL